MYTKNIKLCCFIAEIAEHMTPIVVEAATPKSSGSKQKLGQYNIVLNCLILK